MGLLLQTSVERSHSLGRVGADLVGLGMLDTSVVLFWEALALLSSDATLEGRRSAGFAAAGSPGINTLCAKYNLFHLQCLTV